MNKKRFCAVISIAAATAVLGADGYKLENITVAGGSDGAFVGQEQKEPFSPQTFTKEGIRTLGKQTNMNVFKVIDMSPSVNFSSVDAFGSNESSYHDPVRIRGKNQSGPGGVLSVEGLPVNSNPGGGKTIYDMEKGLAFQI